MVLGLFVAGGLSGIAVLCGAADSKNNSLSVSVSEEILLTQSGANANLKIRLSSGVTAQVWGDSNTACNSPTGSLTETASGTYSIPLNTIPFGSNQNNFVCVHSSDNKLNANVSWPHTAASLAFVQQPTDTAAGSSVTPAVTVSVLDTTGTLISSSSASIALALASNPGGGSLSGTPTKNAVNGIATFNDLSINKAANGYTLAATSTGLTGATSSTFTITAGAATKLTFAQQPSTTTAGNAINPAVTVLVQDANGNTVNTNTNVTMAINGGGILSGSSTTTVAAVGGLATFSNLIPTKSGSFTLAAAAGSLTAATSNNFTVSNAAGFKLVFTTQPGGGTGGTPWAGQPVVTVEDQFNNTVIAGTGNNALILLSITSGTGTAGAAVTCALNPLSASSGVASFSGCNIDKAGSNYTLTASSSGLTSVTSSTFNITAGAAAKLAFTTQPGGGTATAAWSLQPVVTVQDAGGNTVTGSSASITLTIASNPSGGTLTCNTNPQTASSGVSAFSGCKIDKGGSSTFTITAASGALTAATSNVFTIADFAVNANPTSRTVAQKNQTTSNISLTNLGGFSGSVTLTCTDSDAGNKPFICNSTGSGTISFSPLSISGSTTSTMTVNAAANTDTGLHVITITGTYTGIAPSLTRTTTVNVTVQ